MALDLLKKTRWLSLAALVALGSGCAVNQASDDVESASEEGASTDAITQVNHSKVKRQSIGNCWMYATVSWMESLNKMATGTEANVSESYLTFWHWFDQIANGASGDEISTGGSFGVAAELINRYGVMFEKDFIASEADAEMSDRQKSALNAMNAALKDGALKDSTARRDRAKVLTELFKAWQLDENVKKDIINTFGSAVTRTIDKSYTTRRTPTSLRIMRAKDFAAKLKDTKTGEWKTLTLQEAIGTKGYSSWSPRTGAFAWQEVDYPTDAKSRRAFLKRVQKALHDGQPVIISWFVDFNALSGSASFSLEEIARRGGPGHQGGHMTVLHDYEVTNVPGFGTLKAGQEATPEQLQAALADEAQVTFLRIKNSWGAYRPDRWNDAVIPGYHDLMTTYLNGPVKKCAEKDGVTDTTNCYDHTPLWDVTLPAGY
jgi:hypothetical protein